MDEYLDNFISSSLWENIDAKEAFSSQGGEQGCLFGVYKDDQEISPVSTISSNHNLDSLTSPDLSSILTNEQAINVVQNSSLNASSLEQPPVFGELASSAFFTDAEYARLDGCESTDFQSSFIDLHSISPSSQLWPPCYEGIDVVEENLQGYMDMMEKKLVKVDEVFQLDNFSSSVPSEEIQGAETCHFPFNTAPHVISPIQSGFPSLMLQNTPTASVGGSNGNGKPRVRARRGQATDPHSIAERLRREKIAERMKNLQELIPNPTKTDKASMLHEIIEYVKFLQLQVKVLSSSRVGARETQIQGSNDLSTTHQGLDDIVPTPDQVALEHQVIKLMDSNVNSAMQHLESRGICLVPISVATAISNGRRLLVQSNSIPKESMLPPNDNGSSVQTISSSSSTSSSAHAATATKHEQNDTLPHT